MTKTDEIIKTILTNYKNIAVVGLSNDPSRPSYGVTEYMQSQGYKIFPVRPDPSDWLGIKSSATLDQVPKPLEIVNVFRRSDAVASIADQAIELGAKALWLQLGVVDPVSEERARKAGLLVISDRCILVEHRRLL